MLLHKRWVRLVFGALLFAGVLACQTSDIIFVAQQATATSTRTPRPTFTPLPTVTLTPQPPPTQPPPPATRTPTKRPTLRPATRVPTKPPTQPPAPPPPPAQPPPPPAPSFQYGANPAFCSHAGSTYIKGKVYDSTNPDAGGVAGIKVGLGAANGADPWVVVTSFEDGVYSFTLTTDGGGAKTGTYYLWLMDGGGNRVSDMGGPIAVNGLGPDAPGSCWAGGVDFWRR
jgi:hypothetical protein